MKQTQLYINIVIYMWYIVTKYFSFNISFVSRLYVYYHHIKILNRKNIWQKSGIIYVPLNLSKSLTKNPYNYYVSNNH